MFFSNLLGESLEKNYLSAYPEPLGLNFSSGIDFAVSTTTAADFNGSNLSLRLQVNQFGHFQKYKLKVSSRGVQSSFDSIPFINRKC